MSGRQAKQFAEYDRKANLKAKRAQVKTDIDNLAKMKRKHSEFLGEDWSDWSEDGWGDHIKK